MNNNIVVKIKFYSSSWKPGISDLNIFLHPKICLCSVFSWTLWKNQLFCPVQHSATITVLFLPSVTVTIFKCHCLIKKHTLQKISNQNMRVAMNTSSIFLLHHGKLLPLGTINSWRRRFLMSFMLLFFLSGAHFPT